MIQREWSRKELLSFPLWRQKERDDVSEKERTMERVMNNTYRPEAMPGRMPHRGNVTPASSGRVDGPAACRARLGKAWTGRGPGGSWIFASLQKSTTSPDFPRATSLPASKRPAEKQATFSRKTQKRMTPKPSGLDGVILFEQDTGVGPASSAWEADALPMC